MPYKVLLLSGGADSMWLHESMAFDQRVFFDYGQPFLQKEFSKCQRVVDRVIRLPAFARRRTEVNCRNLTFLSVIVSIYGSRELEIYIGSNQNDVYPDNQRDFFDSLERIFSALAFHPVRILTPLADVSKAEIRSQLTSDYYSDENDYGDSVS